MTAFGSLCTGVGQLDLAVETFFEAEMRWYSEIDRDACKVLERHFPGVPNLGDLTAVDWSNVEPVDVLCAGPPCQPVSAAGKRKGHDDERWLWPDVLRAVEHMRPRWLVFENPPGIAPWLPAILCRLAGLGYVGRYGRVRASHVGACHRRERVFVVAHAHGDALRAQPVPLARRSRAAEHGGDRARPATDAESLDGRTGRARGPQCGPADAGGFPWGRYEPAIRRHEHAFGRPAPWPVVEGTRSLSGDFTAWMMGMAEGWLDVGISNTAKKRLAGNAVVARQAEFALRLLVQRTP